MAENIILAQVLVGISALKTKTEIDAVRVAVNEAEENLANGNSDEMIRVNKERYDYSRVPEKNLLKALKWYMAPKPLTKSRSAYHQFRAWNAVKEKGYKGFLIIEKATGNNVTPPQWESEGEEEEVAGASGEDDDEVGEAAEAMAAVRVE
jgi:hypothetical protein